MASYYRLSVDLPEGAAPSPPEARPQTYLPLTWDRMYAVPAHWRHLVQDSHAWGKQIEDETFAAAVARMKLSRPELHRRLARRWQLLSGLNAKAVKMVGAALQAGPLPAAREDLEFLSRLLAAYQPLCEALAEFHRALRTTFAPGQAPPQFHRAAALARDAARLSAESFPQPVDPVGGEVGGLRNFSTRLVAAISAMQKGR
jgi:hypothetical protein